MIGIVIVAHGGLAREYLAAVEHVVGKQPGVLAVNFEADCSRENKQSEIIAAVKAVDKGQGVVVVTDLFGGSPCNLSLEACKDEQRRIIFGANLPMLVKLAKSRRRPLDEAVRAAIASGRKYIDSRIVAPETP